MRDYHQPQIFRLKFDYPDSICFDYFFHYQIKMLCQTQKERTVTLHTYTDASQAEMMQYKLRKGYQVFLNNENVMGLDPIAGVELKIFEKDLAKAEEILRG